jgi:iron complex outermembrane receptor protein
MAGVLVQRAYNPGGATLAFDSGQIDTFKAEHLWDYEAFIKGDLPGGRASVTANLFYNRIGNAQRDLIVPFTLPNGDTTFLDRFDNVPKASTGGAEIEFNWRQSRALTLTGGLGLLRSRIVTRHNSEGGLIGREFERAPHVTASAATDWTPTDRLRLSAQLRYHSRYFSNDLDTPAQAIRPAAIVDARAAYSFNKVTVFAYARNLFDSFRLTYLFDANSGEAEDPRMVAFGVEARF